MVLTSILYLVNLDANLIFMPFLPIANERLSLLTTARASFLASSFIDTIKKVDMNEVQKGVNSMQKAVELLQGLVTKDNASAKESYTPRQLFKKFED